MGLFRVFVQNGINLDQAKTLGMLTRLKVFIQIEKHYLSLCLSKINDFR